MKRQLKALVTGNLFWESGTSYTAWLRVEAPRTTAQVFDTELVLKSGSAPGGWGGGLPQQAYAS